MDGRTPPKFDGSAPSRRGGGQIRPIVTSKRIGGGQIRLQPGPITPIPRPEPQPVNLDAPAPTTGRRPKLDTLNGLDAAVNQMTDRIDAVLTSPDPDPDQCAHHAQRLRDQAAALITQAARLEQATDPHTIGADGKSRPTWDRFNNAETERQVRHLRNAGQSVRAIAETLGCSRGTAHRIIKKLGAN